MKSVSNPIHTGTNVNHQKEEMMNQNEKMFLREKRKKETHNNQAETSGHLKTGRWDLEEHKNFIFGILKYGNDWKEVCKVIQTRSCAQSRSHSQKFFSRLFKMNLEGITEEMCNVRHLHDLALTLNKEELTKLISKLTDVAHERMERSDKGEEHRNESQEGNFICQSKIKDGENLNLENNFPQLESLLNQNQNQNNQIKDTKVKNNLNNYFNEGNSCICLNTNKPELKSDSIIEDDYKRTSLNKDSNLPSLTHCNSYINTSQNYSNVFSVNVSSNKICSQNKLNVLNEVTTKHFSRVNSVLSSSTIHEGYDELFSMEHEVSLDNIYKQNYDNPIHHLHETSGINKEHHSFEEEDFSNYFNFYAEEKNKNLNVNYDKLFKNRYDCYFNRDTEYVEQREQDKDGFFWKLDDTGMN